MDLSERWSATARHPWEIERYRAYRRVLVEHGALSARRVLDVGAGDGWFAESLLVERPHIEQVVCWDLYYSDAELAIDDDPRLIRTRAAPDPGFDLVLVLDVLEHVDDPAAFIDGELAHLTEPGTPALVAVPAHPRLFGNHDRALGHHRRYSAPELLAQLAGWLDVIDHGPLFAGLVPLRAASVAVELVRRDQAVVAESHGVGRWQHGPALTLPIRAALAADSAVTRRLGPLRRRLTGLSHWAYGYTR
jgi:SAM-dependent methyltransferase